jgi:outer membrane protein assembly factor BamB
MAEQRPRQTRREGRPYLLQAVHGRELAEGLRVARAKNPLPAATLGDTELAARVSGPAELGEAMLVLPFEGLPGIDSASVRVFRLDGRPRAFRPVWSSGTNLAFKYVWAHIRRPGVYVAIGLPRDRLLQGLLQQLARRRRLAEAETYEDAAALTRETLAAFFEASEEELDELRALLATWELKTTAEQIRFEELRFREGGHLLGFPLPGNATLDEFRQRAERLEPAPEGLPEEALFYPPGLARHDDPLWPRRPGRVPWTEIDLSTLKGRGIGPATVKLFPLCWLRSRNWWMYHANERHTGQASGCSDIDSTNVGSLTLQSDVPVDGTVVTIPTIVDGKIYVGTAGYGTNAGTLYKIDLATGTVQGKFPTAGSAYYPYDGIGGSPAVVGGRVYFTGVHGKVYCVDAATMTPTPPHPPALWTVNLKQADAAHNQPVSNPNGDCWSSPLVVNGRVYVACGEGEGATFSFVYCLDANTGNVLWLFCTNRFTGGADNAPNVIPQSAVGLSPPPGMFSTHADPPNRGAAPWSSCAYDAALNRVYVGTGNSSNGEPDALYGSGIISLDATTGDFKAFFQPAAADSYRPGDTDVDLPGSPMIFRRGADRVVCIGSKNGSFFLLDPNTLQVLGGGAQRRQLLPLDANTNGPLPTVDNVGGENMWGVFGTAAVHSDLGKLYVGLGGYDGIGDYTVTPFVRALDWNTLADAWPAAVQSVGGHNVVRYTTAKPPLYTNPGEAGLSSPAVVNDVVFVSTSKTALYALRADNGLCLWQAPGMPPGGWPDYCLGPAIYGNYVVVGAASKVLIYHLPGWRPPWPPWPPWRYPWWLVEERFPPLPPWPPPPPPPPELPGPEVLLEAEFEG